jgi:hypothetical protein
MRERRGIWRWVVLGGMVALGTRCDCGGSCFDLGPHPLGRGSYCNAAGCGADVCAAGLECCVTATSRGGGQSYCVESTNCVPGTGGDPCAQGECEDPFVCQGYPGTCECADSCEWGRHACYVDAGACVYQCCDFACGADGGRQSCSWPWATDAGTDVGDGGRDASDDGGFGDGGEATDAEATDADGDTGAPDAEAPSDAADAVDA